MPADDKRNARLIVSRVIAETLKGMKLRFPRTSAERTKELAVIKDTLMAEKD